MEYYTKYISTEKTAVTIGKFDGLHLGHQKLINRVRDVSDSQNVLSVAVSFYPHPSEVLGDVKVFKTIYTQQEKLELLEDMGLDIYIEYPFTLEFSEMEAEYFIEEFIFKKLNCTYLAVGKNYRFGRNQTGTSEMLKKIAKKYGAAVDIVENVMYNNQIVSSSLVRKYILQNDFAKAQELMLRPYYLKGIVAHGKKLGRTIGVPTINIIPSEKKLLPGDGVYLTRTYISNSYYEGITNIGTNPTVSNSKIKTVESHLLNFDKHIYGVAVKLEFIKKIRETVKFNSIALLRKQIEKDMDVARREFLYETCFD